MQLRTWTISSAALIVGAATASPTSGMQSPATPTVVPHEVTGSGIIVWIKVGGQERRMVLADDSPYSYVRSAPEGPATVEAGNLLLGKVRFAEPPAGLAAIIDGAIGHDLLQGMAVGFDEFRHEYALWPKGATPTAQEADAWATGHPAWGGPSKPRRLKMGKLPGGAPCLDLAVGTAHAKALVSLGNIESNVAPSMTVADATLPKDRGLFSTPKVGGLTLPWIVCRQKEWGGDGNAVIAVYSLASRRVLADLTKDTLYVEELPEEARLSKFLMAFTRASVQLRGDGMILKVPPAADPAIESILLPLQGMAVVQIAGIPAKQWSDALRGKGDEGAKALEPLLAKLFGSFLIDVQTPNGVRSINVPGS